MKGLGCHWIHDSESGYPGEIGEIMCNQLKVMNESGGGDQRIAQFQGPLLSQSNGLVEHRPGDGNQIDLFEEILEPSAFGVIQSRKSKNLNVTDRGNKDISRFNVVLKLTGVGTCRVNDDVAVQEHSAFASRQRPVLTDFFLPNNGFRDGGNGVFSRQPLQYIHQSAARWNARDRRGLLLGQHRHQHRDIGRRNRRGGLLPVEQVAMQTCFVGRNHFSPTNQTVALFQVKGKAKSEGENESHGRRPRSRAADPARSCAHRR